MYGRIMVSFDLFNQNFIEPKKITGCRIISYFLFTFRCTLYYGYYSDPGHCPQIF